MERYTPPIFEASRTERQLRPFAYKKARAKNMFRLEDWKDRHIETLFRVMREQKRKPMAHVSGRYLSLRWMLGMRN